MKHMFYGCVPLFFMIFCRMNQVKPLNQNIRVSLLNITEFLTLPGEYVTGKNWHLYSVYHVIMYKQFGWIFSYNSFPNRPKKSSKKK